MAKKSGAKKKKYEKEQIRLSFFEEKHKNVEKKNTVDISVIKVLVDNTVDVPVIKVLVENTVDVPVIKVEENVSKVEKNIVVQKVDKVEDIKIINWVKCHWCGREVEKKSTRYWHTGALICIPCWDEADQKHKKMMEELAQRWG